MHGYAWRSTHTHGSDVRLSHKPGASFMKQLSPHSSDFRKAVRHSQPPPTTRTRLPDSSIVRSSTGRLRTGNAEDMRDARQEALLALFLLPENSDDALRATVAYRAAIDHLRRINGRRNGPSRTARMTVPFEPESHDSLHYDHTHDPVAELFPTGTIPDRTRRILYALMQGAEKQQVAEHFGLHPSRISQLLAEVRTRLSSG